MPPRGVAEGSKRARQYQHIRASIEDRGLTEAVAAAIAARTVNKERARHEESKTASTTSLDDISSGRRGELRSGTDRPKGRTRDQLYTEAKKLGIPWRSYMTKVQLQRAIESHAR